MFSLDIFELQDDGFDDSYDELRISQEVFYGNIPQDGSKRSAGAGVACFTFNQDKMVDISPCSISENSAITNQASSKDISQEDADHADCGGNSQALVTTGGSMLDERISEDLQAKRMKLSVNELCSFKPYLDKAVASSVPLKQVISGTYHPNLDLTSQTLLCHVVESSSEGLTSSCYLLSQNSELYREGNLGECSAPNGSLCVYDGSESKQLSACKSIASPASQESTATKLLVPSLPAVPITEPSTLHIAKERPKSSNSPELEDNIDLLSSDITKDFSALLRSAAYKLLGRAGWSPEKQIRSDGRNRYFYRSPEGRLFRELSRVWFLAGYSLFAHNNSTMMVDDRQWTGIDQFCSDLYDTLRYIEIRKDGWSSRCALTYLWKLLDPFVNVVLINRKLHALRAGNLVRTKQKFDLVGVDSIAEVELGPKPKRGRKRKTIYCGEEMVDDLSLASDTIETHKTRSIYVCEGNSMCHVKTSDKERNLYEGSRADENTHTTSSHLSTCVSDSTCLPCPGGFYDLAGNNDNNVICGQSETFSPHQDSCMSSPGCSKHNMEFSKQNSKDAVVCSVHGESGTLHGAIIDSGINVEKKVEDKSNQFPEIEFCELCQAEARDMLPGSEKSNQLKLADIQHWSMDHTEIEKKPNKFSASMFKHQSGFKKSRFKKCHSGRQQNDCCSEELNSGSSAEAMKKGKRPKKQVGKKILVGSQLKDDDLLVSAIIKKRSAKSNMKKCGPRSRKYKQKSTKKRKSQKGSCRLRLRGLGKGGKNLTNRWTLVNERSVLSWLISGGAVSVNEVVEYRDPKDDVVVKDGLITWDGILCKCCNEVFCVSAFKFHAGFNQNRPCLNLFMGSGGPYTLCQLQAWSEEYKNRKCSTPHVPVDEFDKNDDSCGLCGDGGELLCCDNCPSTFHQSCLSEEELPEGSWYCPNCSCQVCGQLASDVEKPCSYITLKCSQCEKKYHDSCLIERGMNSNSGAPWFCGVGCEKVYGGLQSCVGLINQIGDGYSWTLLKCIHDDQKVSSAQRFALKAECNSKLAVAVTIMEECFLSMIDPRTGINMIPQVVYNWGSEFARLDYHGFYTAVLEKNDVLISVASIRVHGVAVAEMPLIATCSKYRRQGMCRRLLNSIEKMLISMKVEKLVIAAISDLVETWTIGFGFVPMEEDEKKSLKKLNLMVFPGTVMLKKTLFQATDAQNGVQDESGLEKDELCRNRICIETVSDREALNRNSQDDSTKEVANELTVKLVSFPDTLGTEAHSSEDAAKTESDLLQCYGSLPEDRQTNVEGFQQQLEPLESNMPTSNLSMGVAVEDEKLEGIETEAAKNTIENVVADFEDVMLKEAKDATLQMEIGPPNDASKAIAASLVIIGVKEDDEATECMKSRVAIKLGEEVKLASSTKVVQNHKAPLENHEEAASVEGIVAPSNTSEAVTSSLVNKGVKEDEKVTEYMELGVAITSREDVMLPSNMKVAENHEEALEIMEMRAASNGGEHATTNLKEEEKATADMEVDNECFSHLEPLAGASKLVDDFHDFKEDEEVSGCMKAGAANVMSSSTKVAENLKEAIESMEIQSASNSGEHATTNLKEEEKDMEVQNECFSHLEPLAGASKLIEDFREYHLPIVVREGVSDIETQCNNVTENQLSPIEESQEASVLPKTS